MAQTELKIGHFDEAKEGGLVFIKAQVLPLEEREGFAFYLLDVRGDQDLATEIGQIINGRLIRLAERISSKTNLQREFEKLLSEINEDIRAMDDAGQINLVPEKFSATLGIAADDRMYLSGAGEMIGILLHQKNKTRYQIYNLFRGVETEQTKPSWEKIFAVVLDGDLHPGDVFLTANRELIKEVPKDDLMNVISTLPPSGAVVKIRQYFPLKADFGSIILKAQASPKTKSLPSTQTVEELNEAGAKTQHVLEDQRPDVSKLSFVFNILLIFGKIILAALIVTVSLGWGLVKFVYRVGMIIIKADKKQKLRLTKSKTDQFIHGLLRRFNVLPKTSKYILLAVLVLVLILGTSIFFISKSKEKQRGLAEYEASVEAIYEKRDAAEASVIYHDDNQARTLLIEAMNMVANLNTENEERAAKQAELRSELETALNELRHITAVNSPTVLADLREVESEAAATTLGLSTNGIFVFADNGLAYSVDEVSKKIGVVDLGESVGAAAIDVGYDSTNNVFYYLDTRPGITMFDPDQSLLEPVSIGWIENEVPDIEVYARRIYALVPEAEQIIKYLRAGDGFDSGSSWINNKQADLTDTVALSIDGRIYLLKTDGSIVVFDGGEEVNWNHDTIDPSLTGATEIWTDDVSKYLYLLEPTSGRLIVFEKESGKLIVQYQSGLFEGAIEFIADEANKRILILVSTQVLEFPMTHL